MGLIYMRISPSGGKYIGQTIYSEEERWKQHCNAANNPNATDYNTIICKAIRKYGSDNFLGLILENNIPEKLLDEREIFWIDYYKTYFHDNQHGYNMTRGGEGVLIYNFSQEHLNELWLEGKTINELKDYFNCGRDTISRKLRSLGCSSQDIKRQTRLKNYDQNYILRLWSEGKTVTDIAQIMNTDRHTISKLLKFLNITDDELQKQKGQKITQMKNRAIEQLDLEENLIKEWPSAKEAAINLNLDFSSIRKCVRGIRKTCGGFKWREKI